MESRQSFEFSAKSGLIFSVFVNGNVYVVPLATSARTVSFAVEIYSRTDPGFSAFAHGKTSPAISVRHSIHSLPTRKYTEYVVIVHAQASPWYGDRRTGVQAPERTRGTGAFLVHLFRLKRPTKGISGRGPSEVSRMENNPRS